MLEHLIIFVFSKIIILINENNETIFRHEKEYYEKQRKLKLYNEKKIKNTLSLAIGTLIQPPISVSIQLKVKN